MILISRLHTFMNVLYICQSTGCGPPQLLPVHSCPTNVSIRVPSSLPKSQTFHLHESFMLLETLTHSGTKPADISFPTKRVHLHTGDLSPLSPSTSHTPTPALWQSDLLCASSVCLLRLYLSAAVSFILYLISCVFPSPCFSVWPQYVTASLHAHPDHTHRITCRTPMKTLFYTSFLSCDKWIHLFSSYF